VLKFEVYNTGANGYPASSGTTPAGITRLGGSNNNVLDFGAAGVSPWGVWLQVTDRTNLATTYPLLLQPNGGNVGIGTTIPVNKLDVNGAVAIGSYAGTNAAPASGDLIVSGEVGIGTSSPGSTFYGVGNATYPSLQVVDGGQGFVIGGDSGNQGTLTNNTVKAARISMPNYANAQEPVALIIGLANNNGSSQVIIGGGTSLADAATEIDFYTAANATTSGGTERMTINSSGNVGIGTTAPGALLDIGLAGTTTGTMRLEAVTTGYVEIQPSNSTTAWTMTLPGSAGTSGYVLTTDGSGVTSWVPASSVVGSTALSALTSAQGANNIDNATYNQTWTWNSLNSGTGMTLSSSSLTTGNLMALASTSTSASGSVLNVLSGTTSTGMGIYSALTATGNTGYAGYFANTSTTNTGYALYATNTGAGYALGATGTSTFNGNVGIGTTTPQAALDVNGAARVGSTGASCSSTNAGAVQYSGGYLEYCNGSAWTPLEPVQSTPVETAPAGSGYFVMSKTTWNGNLGGLAGADAKCLTDLTTNTGWQGYSTANSNGQLVAAKVHAFLCIGTTSPFTCNNTMPLTSYYFADANNSGAGGAFFTTDTSGLGPNDNADWAAANYFSGTYFYWAARDVTSNATWYPLGQNSSCSGWLDNSSGNTGSTGSVAATDYIRWMGAVSSCDQANHLICFVNP
jgi:hypothetical protein